MMTRSLLQQVQARRKFARGKTRAFPRQQEPATIALAYFAELRRVINSAKKRIDKQLVPLLPELLERAAERRGNSLWVNGELMGYHEALVRYPAAIHVDAMDPGKRVNKMLDRISESFYREWDPSRLTALARKYGVATSTYQRSQLAGQIKAKLGIDPVIAEPGLAQRIKDFTAENVALIKSIPQQFFDQVEQRVVNGVRTGERHEQVAEEIEERFGVSESRAKLIARDQTLKFYGELNSARQQAMGVESYIWRSSNDERVRDRHAELDGTTQRWDDPPVINPDGEVGHPGDDYQCRCSADPVLDDLFAALE